MSTSSETTGTKAAAKKRTPAWVWIVLALPYLGLCFPQLYARATPTLLGFPFFYWYQLGWVVLTSALLGLVYHEHKRRQAASSQAGKRLS